MNPITRWIGGLFEKRATFDQAFFDLIDINGGPTHAGVSVTPGNAMRSTAVYACVRIISESIASLPLVLYQRQGRNRNRATSHPLYGLLHDLPNPELTAMEFREMMLAQVLLWGNAWAEKEIDRSGRVRALWPLRSGQMETVERHEDGLWWGYRLPGGQLVWLPAYRLHHVRGLTPDGVWGYSAIREFARNAIGLSLATEEFGSRFFSNGARPGGYLKHPSRLSPGAYERLKRSFAEDHQGLSNAHRWKILEEGMEVTAIGIPPNEAQFLETRKFQISEIARIFRVPPHMLADLERATFSNIEHQSLEFVIHTLRPWLVRHEQAIYRDLLSEAERRSHFAKHSVDALLRGDTATRYQAYTTGITTGFMTRNEARELEDWNPIDGLDKPLLPLNMVEVSGAQLAGSGQRQLLLDEHKHSALQLRAEVSDPSGWDERAERVRKDRQAMMLRNVRLFEDAARRMIRREVADVRRATARFLGKRNGDEFDRWLATFYEEMRVWLPDYFRPLLESYAEEIMAAVAAEVDGEPAPLDDNLRTWIEGYLTNLAATYTVGSSKQLRTLLLDAAGDEAAEAAINERLDNWQETQPGKTGLDQAFEAGNALAIYGYAVAGIATLRWSARGESCPLCKKLDGRRIPISGAFLDEGQTVEADGVDPLPVVRKIKHGPLHGGCDCVVVRG